MKRFTVAGLLLVLACDRKPADETRAPAATSARAPASAAVPAAPWFAGTWSGKYDARHHLVETPTKEGTVRDWAADDGGEHAGQGTLQLSIDDRGGITGSAEGALGSMLATGEAEGDTLRVQLVPKDPAQAISSAFFIAKRDPSGAKGQLSASTGDSLRVRNAVVELSRGEREAR
jgi:hypothetical protein